MFMKSKKKISICIAMVMIITALFSGSVFATDDTQNPSNLTNLSIIKVRSTAIQLAWDACTDNVGIDHYVIGNLNDSEFYTTTSTTYTVCGLDPETEYTFYVWAEDAAGNSSNAPSVTDETLSQTYANTTYQVYGTIEPDISYSFSPESALKDFEVEITYPYHPDQNQITYTNSNGEYMFPMVPYGYECTITISKPGFLTRTLNLAAITDNKTISDQTEDSIIVWPGDVDSNGAINMADFIIQEQHFNTSIVDPNYVDICDFNKDGAINMIDQNALNAHYNTYTGDYTTNFAVSSAPVKPQY